jgi:hypothetical protein
VAMPVPSPADWWARGVAIAGVVLTVLYRICLVPLNVARFDLVRVWTCFLIHAAQATSPRMREARASAWAGHAPDQWEGLWRSSTRAGLLRGLRQPFGRHSYGLGQNSAREEQSQAVTMPSSIVVPRSRISNASGPGNLEFVYFQEWFK